MKKIIIYYSYTGHTKKIALYMAKKLNCEVLELKPMVPYSVDYQTVVNEEQKNDTELHIRDYDAINTDLSAYDEIILGTPVWWYSISPVIRQFLMKETLKGKKIRPFATNAGLLGKTFNEIAELCKAKGAVYTKGLNVVFTEDYHENKLVTDISEIDKWLSDENE